VSIPVTATCWARTDAGGKISKQSGRNERGRLSRVVVHQWEQARLHHHGDQAPLPVVVPAQRREVSDDSANNSEFSAADV